MKGCCTCKIPSKAVSLTLKDHENIPDITSSVFVGGKPQRLEMEFDSSTAETISAFSLEHFARMEDRLLLESASINISKNLHFYCGLIVKHR